MAVMYLGRGDQPSFAAMLSVVSGDGDNQDVLARRMFGKAPLVKFLRDGLTKLRRADR